MQRFVRKGLRHRNSRYSGLRLERLEERWALAGDVAAGFDVLGNLSIAGDAAENNVIVLVDDAVLPNQLIVRGVNSTTVNGAAEVSFDVDPLIGINSVDIDFGEARIPTRPRSPRGRIGVDTVDIGGFDIDGELTIGGTHGGVVTIHDLNAAGAADVAFGAGVSGSLGFTRVKTGSVINAVNSSFAGLNVTTSSSNDTVVVVDTLVDGDLNVDTGAGVDVVTLTRLDVAGEAALETGTGADQIAGADVVIDGVTTINTGADVDTVNFSSVTAPTEFHSDVFIDLGNGRFNELGLLGSLPDGDPNASLGLFIDGSLTVDAFGSVNVVGLSALFVGGDVNITTGRGVDVIGAAELDVGGNLNIDTGAGVDVVVLGEVPGFAGENHVGGTTTINTGNGNDVVVLARTTFDNDVEINLGAGNDVLVLVDNTFGADVSADGGTGRNTLVFDASFDQSNAVNFRTRTPPNFFTDLMVDILLARGLNFLDDVFG
jgi:hypothetical protein